MLLQMSTLFPIEPILPQGFSYQAGFISEEEEQTLLEEIKQIVLNTFTFQGYEAKRKVASFGYDWNFETRTLSKGKDIPPAFHWLIKRVAAYLQIAKEELIELLVTEYPEGAVINWHRDAPPFDTIAGISSLTDCIFKLKPYKEQKQGRKAIISLSVARRSLYIMKDTSRTEWLHSIAPVTHTRYSITLRTVNTNALDKAL
jgi:alkylated DNA repair dioxygenase AlkB